jgi:hypothetical protein
MLKTSGMEGSLWGLEWYRLFDVQENTDRLMALSEYDV